MVSSQETGYGCCTHVRVAPRAHKILSAKQAIEIYQLKFDDVTGKFKRVGTKISSPSTIVASRYGISPKAVRDIWNHRTWATETRNSTAVCIRHLQTKQSIQVTLNVLMYNCT
mmetsp:Transcript_39620/g.105471  ORF Transcript_39620/g.105471 Transcript_39620/m.105471 type:complete len:113 (+) Transcript_39620:102-440(+)